MANDPEAGTAERLNELGHLAGGIGHHVINAFSAVVSNAEILRLTAGTPEAADPIQIADTIIQTSLEASSLARRLIDFTRPITSVGESRLDLQRVAEEAVEEWRARGVPGVEWVARAEPVPFVKGDASQLRAMLGHLFDNSIEAMRQGGGSVAISTGLDARGWVALEVRDTAGGMSAESRPAPSSPSTRPSRAISASG